jgi:hypothetical protein
LEKLTLSAGGRGPGARNAGSYRPGPPPKFGDAFRASPVGRVSHEYVTRPAANLVGLLGAGLDRAGAFSGILGEPTFEPMWEGAVDRLC